MEGSLALQAAAPLHRRRAVYVGTIRIRHLRDSRRKCRTRAGGLRAADGTGRKGRSRINRPRRRGARDALQPTGQRRQPAGDRELPADQGTPAGGAPSWTGKAGTARGSRLGLGFLTEAAG